MPFTPKTWVNWPSTTTPLNAAGLNDLEERIEDGLDGVEPTPDADATTKGKLRLTGDLGGTAASPTVPGLSGKANTSHTHAQSDITNLTTDLAGKAASSHTHAPTDITGGSDGQVITKVSGSPAWATPSAGTSALESALQFWRPTAATLGESYPRAFASFGDSNNFYGSGDLFLGMCLYPFKKDVTYTNITMVKGPFALANQTNQWFCLVRHDGIVMRSTVNGTTGAWAGNSTKTLALSSTWTPTEDTYCYVGICITTSSGTTGMNFWGSLTLAPTGLTSRQPCRYVSGRTTPLASNTDITGLWSSTATPMPYAYFT
jgi:hypothetical protein